VAERVGFEPTLALARPLFESGTINHSDTSPPRRIAKAPRWAVRVGATRGLPQGSDSRRGRNSTAIEELGSGIDGNGTEGSDRGLDVTPRRVGRIERVELDALDLQPWKVTRVGVRSAALTRSWGSIRSIPGVSLAREGRE
jgi:hypothetical protein